MQVKWEHKQCSHNDTTRWEDYKVEREELANCVYDLICGYWDLTNYPIPLGKVVENEFYPGGPCSRAYGEATAAYDSLCRRLDIRERDDPDVEELICALSAISRHIGIKMFYYGALFSENQLTDEGCSQSVF